MRKNGFVSAGKGNRQKSTKSGPQAGRAAYHMEGKRDKALADKPLWLYGRHAVMAALQNPARKCHRILATKNAQTWLKAQGVEESRLALHMPDAIDGMVPPGAVHQGLAAYVDDLPRMRLKEVCKGDVTRPVVVLDQISDPQNIGAIFRSAAAFGAQAVIVQERRTPPLAGALAKAAAGAVEHLPCIQVVNIARALEALTELGYHCVGLAGDGDTKMTQMPNGKPVALVMGAEGSGLRPLVRTSCAQLARIPLVEGVDSLNVSNAAAIALYEIKRG